MNNDKIEEKLFLPINPLNGTLRFHGFKAPLRVWGISRNYFS